MLQQRLDTALAHQRAGRWAEAEAAYRGMLVDWPAAPEIHYNLGTVFRSQQRLDEAATAFAAALRLRPDFPEAGNNLGNTLRDLGRPAEAVDHYRRAVALRPNFADAWNNLGLACKDTGQLDEALACFERAMSVQPGHAAAEGNRLGTLHFHPGFNAHDIYRAARQWQERHAAGLAPASPGYGNEREPGRRLRVGYVSPDFRRHCQALFTTPLFVNHDHRRFEVFLYSNAVASDGVTVRLWKHADHWREIAGLSDDSAAAAIRADRIDILVDLTLHMAGHRQLVFARPPAPVAVTWLGYPSTTGSEAIAYRLTDPWLDPVAPDSGTALPGGGPAPATDPLVTPMPAAGGSTPRPDVGPIYAEESIRLPETFWCYDPGGMEDDGTAPDVEPGPLPALRTGHVTFGCLNNFCKVTGPTLATWSRVLAAVPGSRLILLAPPGPHRERVADALGLSGAERGRVEFMGFQPRRTYLEAYRRIDLGLDTLPYNGHTTSLDSLWMGVPVLTMPGATAVGRGGISQLHNLGLTDLVARDADDFVAQAAAWAGDLRRLAELRAGLRQRMNASPLMDGPRFARNVEEAYREMWRRWCAARQK